MRFIALLALLTFSSQTRGLELNFDKLRNISVATSQPIEVKLVDSVVTKEFTLKIQFEFEGVRSLKRPEKVQLVFRASTHRWRFLEESKRQGFMTVDGERLPLPDNPTYASEIGEPFLFETLSYTITIADLEKLAKASNIELRVGELEGKLREKQLNRIRAFLNALPSIGAGSSITSN